MNNNALTPQEVQQQIIDLIKQHVLFSKMCNVYFSDLTIHSNMILSTKHTWDLIPIIRKIEGVKSVQDDETDKVIHVFTNNTDMRTITIFY